ncbi:permease-like cell division protein FtsX [Cloacibacillus sp. An23]|uniref:cell division protein FtsX n=1 Tax=Cloacibacillus sp. An23 TaxID=1965591 RepID=UPI000B367F59|nr:permease-like cell division protein FtsX [Cloacibacillus sp. An23]OUO91927.1 cell division protein FtsX [Cloacibacillus sp. An23]
MARIKYIMRDGWRLIWRHFGMSLLTIFTAMAVFFVVGATMLFILNIRSVIGNMENQLSIQAYLKPDAELEKAAAAVRRISGVERVTMITKETALERLRARLGNQADAVTLLGENPLPSSLEIHVSKASQVSDVAGRLGSVAEIEDIVYAGHVAEKLSKLSSFVEKFSIIMLAVALTASGVVLFNTIRISVYSRAEEIDVMMKVGATSTYVAFPFVIQGFILGFFGALAASTALGYSYLSALERLRDMLPFITFIDSKRVLANLFIMLICCGAVVSLIASLIAVEKFIRKASKPL